MQSYFFVIESVNKSLLSHRKHIKCIGLYFVPQFVRVDEQMTHLKVWAKEGISFTCSINCKLMESSVL